jgi:hypothetical protein
MQDITRSSTSLSSDHARQIMLKLTDGEQGTAACV